MGSTAKQENGQDDQVGETFEVWSGDEQSGRVRGEAGQGDEGRQEDRGERTREDGEEKGENVDER